MSWTCCRPVFPQDVECLHRRCGEGRNSRLAHTPFLLHLLHVPFQFITGMAPVAEDDLAEDVRDATGLQHSAFVVDDEMVRDGAEGSDDEGDAGLFVDQSDSLRVCAQHEHYALRGAELEDMNLYEYAGTSVRMGPIVACCL